LGLAPLKILFIIAWKAGNSQASPKWSRLKDTVFWGNGLCRSLLALFLPNKIRQNAGILPKNAEPRPKPKAAIERREPQDDDPHGFHRDARAGGRGDRTD
jgi:hypothetical protein